MPCFKSAPSSNEGIVPDFPLDSGGLGGLVAQRLPTRNEGNDVRGHACESVNAQNTDRKFGSVTCKLSLLRSDMQLPCSVAHVQREQGACLTFGIGRSKPDRGGERGGLAVCGYRWMPWIEQDPGSR